MMSLLSFAKSELNLIYGDEMNDEMNKRMCDHILHMVSEFSKEGHSGFSASYAIGVLNKLLRYEPIGPLTGKDEEWVDVDNGMFQNKRCGRVFKYADGKCYDIDGKVFVDKDGHSYTNANSKTEITFPYTPKTEYVNEVDHD